MANTPEDGKLNDSIRVRKVRKYSDFDLTLTARTTTDGDIFKKTDVQAVKQAIKTLILTNRFEKPYRPNFGADIRGLLFELADETTGDEILSRIKEQIQTYEPRVAITNVKVTATPDYNSVSVILEFRVIATGIIDILKVTLGSAMECDPGFMGVEPVEDFGNRILTEFSDPLLTEGGIFINYDDEEGVYLSV